MSGRFEKVVLTTNGARLTECVDLFKRTINHLNVSRHGIGYEENVKVFGTRKIVTDEALRAASFELNKAGIDVNLNHVYTKDSKLTVDYVLRYLEYARSVGATSVSFRYDQNENSLEPTYLEKLFSEWMVVRSGGCPVCRNHTVLVGGFPVVFKAAFAEPSKAIDDVYELIYHITGKLTTDWEGKREFTNEMAQRYAREFAADPFKEHQVVQHTVAAPSNPARGQRAVPRPQVAVAPGTSSSAGAGAAASVGGGCGTMSLGGGCGSVAPVPRPAKTQRLADIPVTSGFGGGCGSFGGGCGRF